MMTVKDVMSMMAVAAQEDATLTDLVDAMRRFEVGALTVIDADGHPVGVVSEDDLLLKETASSRGESLFESRRRRREHRKAAGATAREMMTSPAITVTEATSVREAAHLMHKNRVKQLPVINAETGRIAGIVHQRDLLKIFSRPAEDIEREIAEIFERLDLAPEGLTVGIEAGVVTLAGRIGRRSQLGHVVSAVRAVDGVLGVRADGLTFITDDLLRVPYPYL